MRISASELDLHPTDLRSRQCHPLGLLERRTDVTSAASRSARAQPFAERRTRPSADAHASAKSCARSCEGPRTTAGRQHRGSQRDGISHAPRTTLRDEATMVGTVLWARKRVRTVRETAGRVAEGEGTQRPDCAWPANRVAGCLHWASTVPLDALGQTLGLACLPDGARIGVSRRSQVLDVRRHERRQLSTIIDTRALAARREPGGRRRPEVMTDKRLERVEAWRAGLHGQLCKEDSSALGSPRLPHEEARAPCRAALPHPRRAARAGRQDAMGPPNRC